MAEELAAASRGMFRAMEATLERLLALEDRMGRMEAMVGELSSAVTALAAKAEGYKRCTILFL
jgi:hypothetical protein